MSEGKIALTLLEDGPLYVDHNCLLPGEKDGGKWLGGGDFGSVGVVCLANELREEGCKHAIKALNLEDNTFEDAKKEASMAHIASDLGIGPYFVRSFVCQTHMGKYFFIITERYTIDLREYLEEIEEGDVEKKVQSLKKCLIMLMKQCVEKHFYHGDLCSKDGVNEGNVMLRLNKKGFVEDAKLIDFDNCEIDFQGSENFNRKVKNQWCCFWNDMKRSYDVFKEYTLDKEQIADICKM